MSYGTTNFNGKAFTLTEQADFAQFFDEDGNEQLQAAAIDEAGNKCIAYFKIKNASAEMDSEDFADYENATNIEYLD